MHIARRIRSAAVAAALITGAALTASSAEPAFAQAGRTGSTP